MDLSDARVDALILDEIARRMHSYDTLVRLGPTSAPPGTRLSRERLAASVERLDRAGYVDWYKDGGWLAASQSGRRRNLDLQDIDLEEIDLRPGDLTFDQPIVLDEPIVLDDDRRTSTGVDDRSDPST